MPSIMPNLTRRCDVSLLPGAVDTVALGTVQRFDLISSRHRSFRLKKSKCRRLRPRNLNSSFSPTKKCLRKQKPGLKDSHTHQSRSKPSRNHGSTKE